jgi:hypothetical protein
VVKPLRPLGKKSDVNLELIKRVKVVHADPHEALLMRMLLMEAK